MDRQCNLLFAEVPIPFKARRDNALDAKIDKIIEENDIKIPIIHIKDNMYLIGCTRCNCTLKNENVVVRVGGGTDKLDWYINCNHINI